MPTPYPDNFDLVILGGGFAGIYAAKSFQKTSRRLGKTPSVAIVADENHMVFQPMLPEVAGAALSPRHVVNPIRNLCRESTVFKAHVSGIDLANKSLTLEVGDFVGTRSLGFQHLAICLGAKIDLSRTPGMPEHALLLQNVGDAMRIRSHFISRLEEANLAGDIETRRRLLSFVIVGGGFSGVETAGQLIDLAHAIRGQYKNLSAEDFTFTLVHSKDHLLPTLNKSLGAYTETYLRKRGLVILLERRATAATANRVYLDNGELIETNTVICTVGNAPHPLIQNLNTEEGLELEKGRIRVESDCSITKFPGVWAAGDCAALTQENAELCPPTAQFASRQGQLLGSNIARSIAEKETRPFRFKAIGELAAIGHHRAVAEIKGLRFSGLLAWWLWRSIYLLKLPGLERKLRVVFDWTLELFFPRDINLLNPRYSTDISETHLETGDTLFQKGDPAFSFYIVKSGSIELLDGDERITIIHAHEHFGERALLENRTFLFHARALEPTTLVTIRSSVFKQIVQSDSQFSEVLTQSARSYLTNKELDELLDRLPNTRLDSSVRESMSSQLTVLSADGSVSDAIDAFQKRSRHYLPVVNALGKPLGAISKETLYMQMLTTGLSRESKIDSVPLVQLPTIDQNRNLRETLTLLTRENSRKALAIDESGKLVGVISLSDILEAPVKSGLGSS